MRTVRWSITAQGQLRALLDHGLQNYRPDFVEAKAERVVHVVEQVLRHFPGLKPSLPDLGLIAYPVSKTPFVVLYDYDEHALRIHLVVHRHADLDALDPTTVEW